VRSPEIGRIKGEDIVEALIIKRLLFTSLLLFSVLEAGADPGLAPEPLFCHIIALIGLLLIALPKSVLVEGVCRPSQPCSRVWRKAPTEITSQRFKFLEAAATPSSLDSAEETSRPESESWRNEASRTSSSPIGPADPDGWSSHDVDMAARLSSRKDPPDPEAPTDERSNCRGELSSIPGDNNETPAVESVLAMLVIELERLGVVMDCSRCLRSRCSTYNEKESYMSMSVMSN